MKIATWNVNSMNVRLPHVLEWLSANDPDVLVLQEIKQVTEAFPVDALTEAGYQSVANGQKTYNGVAVIAKSTPRDPVTELPGLAKWPGRGLREV
jgi:exodeoxyribonuclease-3